MIEEAEKAATPESTVEERVAKGETYIDGTGNEVSLDKPAPTLLSDVMKNAPEIPQVMTGIKEVDDEPVDIKPTLLSDVTVNLNAIDVDTTEDSKKKTYMIKDDTGQIQTKIKE